MRKIGILGGTFDPPHIGHLIIAEEVRRALHLSEVWFIPSKIQVHKDQAQTTALDRLQMVERAIASNPYFQVNPIEIKDSRKSYTIHTMRQLSKQYPEDQFYFIIGADMVEYLPHWKKIDELIQLVQFVGVKRYGYSLETAYPLIQVDIPEIRISSTDIRKRLANEERCRYLIPKTVFHYIKENRLYGY